MGYNERNPSFTFRFGEYRHGKLNKLAKLEKMPTVDFIRKILDQWLSGNLIEKSNDDTATEHAKLKLLKLKAEIEYLQLKNNYMRNFGAPLSVSATRILKPQIKGNRYGIDFNELTKENQVANVSPYDEKNDRLQCTECGILFTWENIDSFCNQLEEFTLHMTNNHGRELNHLEKSALSEINFKGAST